MTHTNITSQSFVTCVFKSFVFCYYSCLFCNAYLYLSKFTESEYHYYMKRKFCHFIFFIVDVLGNSKNREEVA